MSDSPISGYDVAIVGMAGRFPGARNVSAFWRTFATGSSRSHFSPTKSCSPPASARSISATRPMCAPPVSSGFRPFRRRLLRMQPRDAAVFDPQHRFFLECRLGGVRETRATSATRPGRGRRVRRLRHERVHVLRTCSTTPVAASVGEWLVRHTGNDTNFLATRALLRARPARAEHERADGVLARRSSPSHLACQSLLNGRVRHGARRRRHVALAAAPRLPPQGGRDPLARRPLPGLRRAAAGTVVRQRRRRRVPQAARRRAWPTATTCSRSSRGSAINNDGAGKVGYRARASTDRRRSIAEALALAGVDPRDDRATSRRTAPAR